MARTSLCSAAVRASICAGASFDELKSIRDAAGGKEFFMGFARVILAMTRCPKVIIARVHGKTVGGGVGLVAAADYAMAVETASVRLSELAVGIGPFVVGPAIQRKIGLGGFSAMAVDAEWRSARWAEEFGLYSRVFDSVNDCADRGLPARSRRSRTSGVVVRLSIFWRYGGLERLLEARRDERRTRCCLICAQCTGVRSGLELTDAVEIWSGAA
jgi:methylglutaconyl-CoA hydratase